MEACRPRVFKTLKGSHNYPDNVTLTIATDGLQSKLNDCLRNTTAVCNPRQNSVRGKVQSETKYSLRHNSVQEKIVRKKNLSEKKIVSKKNCLRHCLQFPVRKVSCLEQIDAYHHEAENTYRNKCLMGKKT